MKVPRRHPRADTPVLRNRAFEFIANHRAGALATADKKGNPHVVVVYFGVDKDLSLYFSTRVESRKYKNIIDRPTVAMAFSDRENIKTMQVTGKAKRVDDLAQEQKVLQDLMQYRYGEPNWPAPPMKLYEHGATDELAVIKVIPSEMTFADFATAKAADDVTFFHKII